jgi:hypothetical protein
MNKRYGIAVLLLGVCGVSAYLLLRPTGPVEVQNGSTESPREESKSGTLARKAQEPSQKPSASQIGESGKALGISALAKVDADARADLISSWAESVRKAKSKEERSRAIQEGLAGFESLDPSSKDYLQMTYSKVLINQDDPDAKKFINTYAEKNADNPNVLVNLLQDLEVGKEGYSGLLTTAKNWVVNHQEIHFDPAQGDFKSDDPKVKKGVEGSKFVTFEVDQIRKQLIRVRAL